MAADNGRRDNLFARIYRRLGATRFGGWMLLRVYTYIDSPLLRWTEGRFSLSSLSGLPVALVTTTGSRSGLPRSVPLMLTPDGDDFALIASRAGRPNHPGWYYNLKANPEAGILFSGRSGTYTAREVEGEERERLWAKANALYDGGFDKYQARAGGRVIPVILLTERR